MFKKTSSEQLLNAARADLLRGQTLLSTQLVEGVERLRAAQVSFLLERPAQHQSASESSAGALGTDQPRPTEVHSCDTRRDVESDGHSYADTIVRGVICRGSSGD